MWKWHENQNELNVLVLFKKCKMTIKNFYCFWTLNNFNFPKNFWWYFLHFFLSRRRQDFLRLKLRRLCLLTSKTDWRNCDGSDNSTDRITSSIVNSRDTITLSCIIWSKEERKKRFYSHFVQSEKSFCCRSASKKRSAQERFSDLEAASTHLKTVSSS